jgi:hypothetical protein
MVFFVRDKTTKKLSSTYTTLDKDGDIDSNIEIEIEAGSKIPVKEYLTSLIIERSSGLSKFSRSDAIKGEVKNRSIKVFDVLEYKDTEGLQKLKASYTTAFKETLQADVLLGVSVNFRSSLYNLLTSATGGLNLTQDKQGDFYLDSKNNKALLDGGILTELNIVRISNFVRRVRPLYTKTGGATLQLNQEIKKIINQLQTVIDAAPGTYNETLTKFADQFSSLVAAGERQYNEVAGNVMRFLQDGVITRGSILSYTNKEGKNTNYLTIGNKNYYEFTEFTKVSGKYTLADKFTSIEKLTNPAGADIDEYTQELLGVMAAAELLGAKMRISKGGGYSWVNDDEIHYRLGEEYMTNDNPVVNVHHWNQFARLDENINPVIMLDELKYGFAPAFRGQIEHEINPVRVNSLGETERLMPMYVNIPGNYHLSKKGEMYQVLHPMTNTLVDGSVLRGIEAMKNEWGGMVLAKIRDTKNTDKIMNELVNSTSIKYYTKKGDINAGGREFVDFLKAKGVISIDVDVTTLTPNKLIEYLPSKLEQAGSIYDHTVPVDIVLNKADEIYTTTPDKMSISDRLIYDSYRLTVQRYKDEKRIVLGIGASERGEFESYKSKSWGNYNADQMYRLLTLANKELYPLLSSITDPVLKGKLMERINNMRLKARSIAEQHILEQEKILESQNIPILILIEKLKALGVPIPILGASMYELQKKLAFAKSNTTRHVGVTDLSNLSLEQKKIAASVKGSKIFGKFARLKILLNINEDGS